MLRGCAEDIKQEGKDAEEWNSWIRNLHDKVRDKYSLEICGVVLEMLSDMYL
jgi:hypothetical protein